MDVPLFTRMWSSGFLPTSHTGVALRAQGDPVLYLDNPAGVDATTRRTMLDALGQFNHLPRRAPAVPRASPGSEPPATLDLYGPGVKEPGTFAASCLLARRLVERGVRVVQVNHRGWDQHGTLPEHLRIQCLDTDHGCYGLLADLKARDQVLNDVVLPAWASRCGAECAAKWTDTIGKTYGLVAKAK